MKKNIKLALALSGVLTAIATPITTSVCLHCKPYSDSYLQNAKEHAKYEAKSNSFASTSSIGSEYDDKITYSLGETRSYDGFEQYFDGGIRFDKTKSGYNGGRNGYKSPVWDDKSNTLHLDRTGADTNYHFIAKKIRIDVTVPAHETNYNVTTEINGETTSYAHGCFWGFRVNHILEVLDLGDNENNNPTFFNDTWHPNKSENKYHVDGKQIFHKKNTAGGETYHDAFNTKINFVLNNSSEQDKVISHFIMIAITTNGENGKYGRIGSDSKFQLKTYGNISIDNFDKNVHFEGNENIKLYGTPIGSDKIGGSIALTTKSGKSDIWNIKIIAHDQNSDTNQLINDKCYCIIMDGGKIEIIIPKEFSNQKINIYANSDANKDVNIKINYNNKYAKARDYKFIDGQDLSIDFIVEKGHKFSADGYCEKGIDTIPASLDKNNIIHLIGHTKLIDETNNIWNYTIPAVQLNSAKNIAIDIDDKTNTISYDESMFNLLQATSNMKIEQDLRGWDWEHGQWSDYMDWVENAINKLKEELDKNKKQYDENSISNLESWMKDHGKEVHSYIVNNETVENIYKVRCNQKNEKANFKTSVELNGEPLYYDSRNFSSSTLPVSLMYEKSRLSNKNAINFKINDDGSFQIDLSKSKSSRYIYIPFKITITSDKLMNSIYNLFPAFNFHMFSDENFRIFHGHHGNPYITELFYFGNDEKAANLKPESFSNNFDAKLDSNKLDNFGIWRNTFWTADASTCTKDISMQNVNKKFNQQIIPGKTVTLYFGLYFASKDRPNKWGENSASYDIYPVFADANQNLSLSNGTEKWAQSRQFERDSSKNGIESFSVDKDLSNDKNLANTDKVETINDSMSVKPFNKNNNIRGLYLPTYVDVKLPAHSKAKVNVQMNVDEMIHRNTRLSAWETQLKSTSSFYKLDFSKGKCDYDKLIVPASNKYNEQFNRFTLDQAERYIKSDDMAFVPLKQQTKKISADVWEIVALTLEIAVDVATIVVPFAIEIRDFILTRNIFLLTTARQIVNDLPEWVEIFTQTFLGRSSLLISDVIDAIVVSTADCRLWNMLLQYISLALPYIGANVLKSCIARILAIPIDIMTDRVRHHIQSNDLAGVFTSCGEIYKDVEIVNNTDHTKIFRFNMAYTNVLAGTRCRENDMNIEYAIKSNVHVNNFEKI